MNGEHTSRMSAPHLHLMLTHAPIVFSLVGLGMFVVAIARRSAELRAASCWVIIAAAITAVAVYVTGEASEDAIEHIAGVSERFIEQHADAAKVSLAGSELLGLLAAFILFIDARKARGVAVTAAALLFVGAVEMLSFAYTANLGGQIRHTEIRPGTTQTSVLLR